MSWDSSARSSSGPMVGRLITVATMSWPDMRRGSSSPAVLTNGLSAMRTGYFSTTFHSGSPLARAVSTYGLFISSSRLARTMRVKRAVPSVPSISIGTHRLDSMSTTLPPLHGACMYSSENKPVTLMSNQLKANHITTSAIMKLGVPTPRYDRKVKK